MNVDIMKEGLWLLYKSHTYMHVYIHINFTHIHTHTHTHTYTATCGATWDCSKCGKNFETQGRDYYEGGAPGCYEGPHCPGVEGESGSESEEEEEEGDY
jgi:hypothetical protein